MIFCTFLFVIFIISSYINEIYGIKVVRNIKKLHAITSSIIAVCSLYNNINPAYAVSGGGKDYGKIEILYE